LQLDPFHLIYLSILLQIIEIIFLFEIFLILQLFYHNQLKIYNIFQQNKNNINLKILKCKTVAYLPVGTAKKQFEKLVSKGDILELCTGELVTFTEMKRV